MSYGLAGMNSKNIKQKIVMIAHCFSVQNGTVLMRTALSKTSTEMERAATGMQDKRGKV